MTQRQVNAIALNERKADDYTRIPQAVAMVREPAVRPEPKDNMAAWLMGGKCE